MSAEQLYRIAVEAQNPWWAPNQRWAPTAHPQRREAFDKLRRDLLDVELRRGLLLLGPRQVGKSTLLHQVAESLLDEGWPPGNLTFFDFDDPRLRGLDIDVAVVEELVPPVADPEHARILLLDEIHTARQWAS